MQIKKLLILIMAIVGIFTVTHTANAAYRDTIIGESNLLYYWPMDATSGSSLTAAVGSTALNVTGATVGATGRIDGTAVSFDGVNDFAATASTLNLSAYNKVVVEAIMYIPSYPNLLSKNAWEFGVNVGSNNGAFSYAVDGGTNNGTAAGNVALFGNTGYSIALYNRFSAANWHHVVAVYDKSLSTNEVSLYIDGTLQTATSRPFNLNNTNSFSNLTLYLMSRAGTGTFTAGSMQHLAIYSDLSAARITAHADLLNTASAVTLSGPVVGAVGQASSNFTVGGNATLGSSTIVTPSDGGNGGTFTPTSVTISSGTPTATFTYTAASSGTKTISVTNNQGLVNPSSISYVASNPATAVTLSGPSSGYVSLASTNFTVGANGAISGSVVVTPSDGGDGGTFTPTSVTISSGSPTATFTYSAYSVGTKTISVSDNGGLTDPSSISYTASIATYQQTVAGESTLLYYWPMTESSGTSLAATTGSIALTAGGGATVGSTGKFGNAVSFDGINDYAVSASALALSSYSKLVVEGMVYIPSYGTTSVKTLWGAGTSLTQTTGTFAYSVDGGTNGSTASALNAVYGNVGYNGASYTRPTTGSWHHIVTVYDKTQTANENEVYIDGVLQTASSRPFTSNNSNAFGNLAFYLMTTGNTIGYLGGKVQQLAIYSDLNSTQIGLHANLAAAAANILISGPSSGLTGVASTDFTVSVDGTLGYHVVITPNDGGDGGTFTPASVTLEPESPTATFTYTPESVGAKTISLTNDDALTNPSGLSFTANPNDPATTVTLSGPSSGAVGVASTNYTVGADGSITGTVVVTPSDSGAGGTFTPTTVSISSGSPTATFTYTPATPGTKTISITNDGSLANHAAFSYSVYGKVLAIGDSTVATYDGGTQIIDFLFTTDQSNLGWTATSIAVPGNTIAQQKTAYLATSNRATFDATIVEIGLNDVNPAEAASVAIARLQDLIATINSNKKVGSKIIIATMTPARQRFIDVYGATNGPIAYQKWLDMNDAIKGNGPTPITDVDYRVSRHSDLLNDGSGNLRSIYEANSVDHIHENNAARTIIGRTWRDGMARIGQLNVAAPSTPTIGTATGGTASASVGFTISDFDGGADVTYTAISTPSSITGTGSSSPITVSGLSATPYTFKVFGTNTAGSSGQSSSSNSVTPIAGDTTSPTISEVTAVSTPTNDSTPDYVFTTNEAGTITYGGSCSSATTSASSGSNTITFSTLTDATYSDCTITVTDAASNASTPLAVTTFRVDATAPTVSSLSPTDNATNVSATANLVITFNEAVTVNTGNITIKKTSDDTTVETIDVTSGLVTGSGTTIITINPSVTLSSGIEYYVQIDSGAFRDAATNGYGGISSTTAWSFTVADTTNPVVSLIEPSNGVVVSGASVTVSASASDNIGVAGVQFKLDGSNLGTEDTSAAYSITWDSTGASDGSHTLSAVARDAAGNTATTSSITVTVDNTAPVRSAGIPTGTLAFGTTTATLSLSTDESATCKYSTNSGTVYGSMTAFSTTGGTTHSEGLTGLSSGSYTYYVKCADSLGNTNAANYTIAFDIATDSTNPIVSLTSPADATVVSGSTVTISASASDNDAIVGVQFKLDGSTNIGSEDTSAPYAVSWDSTAVSDGTHTLSAVARDTTGNTATDTVTVTVDNTAPVRSAAAPSGVVAAGTTSTAISLTTNESATCKYSTNSGTAYGSMTSFTSTGGTSHSQTVTGLSNGNSYAYYVKCSDEVGNVNGSNYTITFDVDTDTVAPTISGIATSSITSSSVVISWSTDEGSNSQVEYGLTTSYGSTTSLDSSLVTSHSVTLSGLDPLTTYHYRVISSDASTNTATSADQTFTTTAAPVVVNTGGVSGGGGGGGWVVNIPTALLPTTPSVVLPTIPTTPLPTITRSLKTGTKGNDVMVLQKLLVKLGYKITADGAFGKNTQKAVKAFQAKYKLKVDGIIGPKTIEMMRKLI